METITDEDRVNAVLARNVEKIFPSTEALREVLKSGKRLRIYLGIDPTSPHLHLGHAVSLFALKRFQDLGHEIILLFGDFTAQIGDPTDKLATRKPLTKEQVEENFKTFKKQASRILSFRGDNTAKILFNSKWLNKMNLPNMLSLAKHLTVQQLLGRDMFQERIAQGKPISLEEFVYPMLQGYDSVAMEVDMEVGGNDQTFNMLVGRDLLRSIKQKEKFVFAAKLLIDPITGKKFSKTEGGEPVQLDDEPNVMFGKIMAMADGAIGPLAELCTELTLTEVEEIKILTAEQPREAKLKVAMVIVERISNKSAAVKAKREFIRVFSEKEKPADIPTISVGTSSMVLVDLLVASKCVQSKSEARRLIEQGGVQVNDVRKTNPNEMIAIDDTLIQVGPRRFVRARP